MFDIEWRYTSPQGRNRYESKSKITLDQVSRMLSNMEENIVSKSNTKYQESLINQGSKNDNFTITNTSFSNNHKHNSIIDVTGQSTNINTNYRLEHYIPGIPEWKSQYSYHFSEINEASTIQKEFYEIFKYSYLSGIYYNLYKNTNYAFNLINDFDKKYERDKNFLELEIQLKKIILIYPEIKLYSSLIISRKKDANNISTTKNVNVYSNDNFYDDYWKLGNKYKDKLKLNEDEIQLLNCVYNPSNNFFNIEYCGLEIIKLYIAVISALKDKYIQDKTTIDEQFLMVADVIARKQFRYRNGSENYKYCIQSRINDFYSNIFKYCENEVREFYGHQRKISITNYGSVVEVKNEFETRINSKILEILLILTSKIAQPDEATEINLYTQNTSRWKIKFEQLVTIYNDKPKEFIDSILALAKLNKDNPSVENIFFEASKFIYKFDKESAIFFYFYYVYYDLISSNVNNRQLTKVIKGYLFQTNEQLQGFEKIVTDLIKDKDLEKALKQIPEIYINKRKKIQLNRTSINEAIEQHSETAERLNEYLRDDFEDVNNTVTYKDLDKSLKSVSKEYEVKKKKIQLNVASINEVQQKHSETVELLNEYLKDDFEDENSIIKSQEISSEEIQIEIIQKSEEVHQSAFISELTFTAMHTTTLELFAKSNFSVSQSELEVFAKSKGVFKNQLIESINDTCYEFLDDVLIEEEEDYYTINTNYFQRISTK